MQQFFHEIFSQIRRGCTSNVRGKARYENFDPERMSYISKQTFYLMVYCQQSNRKKKLRSLCIVAIDEA